MQFYFAANRSLISLQKRHSNVEKASRVIFSFYLNIHPTFPRFQRYARTRFTTEYTSCKYYFKYEWNTNLKRIKWKLHNFRFTCFMRIFYANYRIMEFSIETFKLTVSSSYSSLYIRYFRPISNNFCISRFWIMVLQSCSLLFVKVDRFQR